MREATIRCTALRRAAWRSTTARRAIVLSFAALTLALPAGASAWTYCYGVLTRSDEGSGSSCATFNRQSKAEEAAIEDARDGASDQCWDVYDTNPGFWDTYCELLCDYHDMDHSSGYGVCWGEDVIDQFTWYESQGCGTVIKSRKWRSEATVEVECGCYCYKA